jgi:hypothetical protein
MTNNEPGVISGEVIQFLRDFDGLSFREACARVGQDLPDDKAMATMILNPDRKTHVIVEAELDEILVAQDAGDLVGVVALGSASTKPDKQTSLFLNKSRHILNALVFDGAGALSQMSFVRRET